MYLDLLNFFELFTLNHLFKFVLFSPAINADNWLISRRVPMQVATLDTHDSSITERREKEKLEFTEGRCVTKFYSKGSTISEDSIADVNEVRRERYVWKFWNQIP